MALKDDIARFLRTNAYIKQINFSFGSFKVYPSAYQKDVADAIVSGEIKVRTKGASTAAAGASYDVNYDSLELNPSFNLSVPRDQAFLIHECTHAHLDIQTLGTHSKHENEAVAYLAEAVFLEAAKQPPLGNEAIRAVSHRLGKMVLAKTYTIPAGDVAALIAEVRKHPHYSGSATYNSNGFNRSLIHKALR